MGTDLHLGDVLCLPETRFRRFMVRSGRGEWRTG
jgi:hypothetical protein